MLINFITRHLQEYYSGDLQKCETSFDKLGRTAQVRKILVLQIFGFSTCSLFLSYFFSQTDLEEWIHAADFAIAVY